MESIAIELRELLSKLEIRTVEDFNRYLCMKIDEAFEEKKKDEPLSPKQVDDLLRGVCGDEEDKAEENTEVNNKPVADSNNAYNAGAVYALCVISRLLNSVETK